MAKFGQSKSPRREEFEKLLPKLYKYALVLTAHEQLSRALVRATCRTLPRRSLWADGGQDAHLPALKHMHSLWAAKLAETPSLRQNCPAEPGLFAGVPTPVAGVSTVHFAKFIANLSCQQRAALFLVYGDGASYDEAADVLSVDILSLMKLLSRGHAALAHWLEHRGFNDRPIAEASMAERRMAAGYAMTGQAA